MNYLRFRQTNIVPPGGWRFHCPEKHYWSKTDNVSLKTCLREMAQFYKDNGVNLPENPSRKIEQELCEQLGPEWCEGFDPSETQQPALSITLKDLQQGMVTMAHNLARSVEQGRRITVDLEEVKMRAHICSTCPYNTKVSGCGSCSGRAVKEAMNSVANYIVGCPETPDDKFLQNCGICKCSLKAKICVPVDIIKQHMLPEQLAQLPEFCWIK
jgi:hypothetical protein